VFEQHPRQHREGGDRHRDADEQRERDEVDGLAFDDVVPSVQVSGKQDAEHKRNAHRRHGERGGAVESANQAEIELKPDGEHEDHHPQITQRGQIWAGVEGEQLGAGIPGERSEHRRSEQQPGDDLADHLRLPDPGRGPPRQLGNDDDHRDVDEDRCGQLCRVDVQVFVRSCLRVSDSRHRGLPHLRVAERMDVFGS
jgi:hypothetical protein